jgi:hypothetical protein
MIIEGLGFKMWKNVKVGKRFEKICHKVKVYKYVPSPTHDKIYTTRLFKVKKKPENFENVHLK